ncbi:MAG TPA: hypothetical protein VNV39_18385, partial [Stellaceae bacterium]|nr:hypothetical protein [Stellaceae bacterium]
MSRRKPEAGAAVAESTATMTDRIDVSLRDGCALVFSDCHYDPEAPASTAHRAVVHLAKKLKPDLLVCGGNALDWAGLSRHPKIMFEARPSPVSPTSRIGAIFCFRPVEHQRFGLKSLHYGRGWRGWSAVVIFGGGWGG